MKLHDWQVESTEQLRHSLELHGVAADGSDTGTGKTHKVLYLAKEYGFRILVLAPKSACIEWENAAAQWGVGLTAINYEQARSTKTKWGRWHVPDMGFGRKAKSKVFEWLLPSDVVLVFDEAHKCGGMDTLNAALLIAARRQHIPHILLSATLLENPLRGRAIGYSLGLHKLHDFVQWCAHRGVRKGFFGLEWKPHLNKKNPRTTEQVMEEMRVMMGERFTRIRKAEVPNFPANQVIPQFVQTDEMPDLGEASEYGMEARAAVELLKVPHIAEQAEDLVEAGYSVPIFVNFSATRLALAEKFPTAGMIFGGQTQKERATVLNDFQHNHNPLLIIMAQAGGQSINLHDLHGRPRAAIISPGWSATEFLQVIGRVHRAGALSPAINYVLYAAGVPVERRMRTRLEAKLNNLTALNDADFAHLANNAPA